MTNKLVCLALVGLFLAAAAAAGPLGNLDIGDITSKAQSATKAGKALRKGFSDLTEREEYYIGRTVAAMILARYKVYENAPLTGYVNRVGGLVAAVSERPETYGGYHFWVLDSDEINAFAAPGGFIFVTRGLLARAPDEEAVAAVLAHEVGHVCLKHGLKAIKQSRLTSAFGILAAEGAKQYGSEEVAQLTEAFDGAVSDIVQNMMEKGYSRSQEYDADQAAVTYMVAAGYCPIGLTGLLDGLAQAEDPAHKGAGFGKTHPSPEQRRSEAEQAVAKAQGPSQPDSRRGARWQPILQGLPRE